MLGSAWAAYNEMNSFMYTKFHLYRGAGTNSSGGTGGATPGGTFMAEWGGVTCLRQGRYKPREMLC